LPIPANIYKGVRLKGKAWKFGNNISTDLIAPGRYFHLRSNLPALAKHVLEDADPDFAKKVKKGDFVVAGKNFGLGSSREHAAAIIKIAGSGAILAKSFSRIFFRNAINSGIAAIACNTDKIKAQDVLDIDLKKGIIKNLTRNTEITFNPLPPVMRNILKDGGLVKHIRKHKDFKL
jgi:3-isopropylmalate/(R)-2-methylmalate dehydratase small subunit